jgi:2-polyprenyl-6-methoxyphenol hydroxylase-like FAD-dependent oxidoreductase
VVLIVGAGPTGLALACGLLSAGVETRIVDAADGPATTSRALGLQPRGVETLDRLGALSDLPERAVHIAGTIIRVNGVERLRLAVPAGTALNGRTALVISQVEIEARLRARVAELGGTIEWGRGLLGVEQDERGVTSRLADGDNIQASWLVGCDGARSLVRKSAGIRLVGGTVEERFLLADVAVRLPVDRDFASMWMDNDGALATIPLPGDDRWRLMAPVPPDSRDDLLPEAIVRLLTALLARRVGGETGQIEDVVWTSTFHIHRRLAETYRAGRVFLAGDAAHINSPVGGQGMNTGIGDAENLAFKLVLVAHGRVDARLLDSYEAERRPVAKAVVSTVGGIDRLLLSKHPIVAFARDRVILPMVNRPAIQRRVWQKASQLGVTYRKGPLAQARNHRRGGLRSGDRVPDLPCRRPDGTPTRLHAELRGRWALLTSGGGAAKACADLTRERLGADLLTELTPVVRCGGHLVLVRPDGHLGWQGPPDPIQLGQWLDAALPRPR